MNKILTVLALSALVLSSACTTRLTDFTAISTKNFNISVKKGERVEGEDCVNLLFNMIPLNGNMQPNLKSAIDNAIEKGRGEGLIDGVVYNKVFLIPFFTHACYKVEGTVVSAK